SISTLIDIDIDPHRHRHRPSSISISTLIDIDPHRYRYRPSSISTLIDIDIDSPARGSGRGAAPSGSALSFRGGQAGKAGARSLHGGQAGVGVVEERAEHALGVVRLQAQLGAGEDAVLAPAPALPRERGEIVDRGAGS